MTKCRNPQCGWSQEAHFSVCPKCGMAFREAVEKLRSKKNLQGKSQSNIAYLGTEMMMFKSPGEALGHLMYQIDQLKDKNMRAWYVDIVHANDQVAEAMWLSGEVSRRLNEINRQNKQQGDTVVVRINPHYGKFTEYRAEKEMKQVINEHRGPGALENIEYKDQDGKKLPIEY